MTYSHATLHKLLLQMQSLDYPRYGKYSEVDVLMDLLRQERIIDYSQVEWKAFWKYLYKEQRHLFPFGDDNEYSIVIGQQLEQFCDRIIGKVETVRLLTYFRDHAAESVFKGDIVDNIPDFEHECSRLIYVYTNERRPDEYHGHFACMAHPNLPHIALGDSAKPRITTPEDQIIADNLPSYPHDCQAFSSAVIIAAAHHFVEQFRADREAYNRLRADETKPIMKPQAYKDPIRDEIIRLSDRLLYVEEEPIYQVIWVMAVLMRLPRKSEWWEDHIAQNFIDYLDCTKYFSGLKPLMDKTISSIRRLTEPTLGLFDDDVETTMTKPSVSHSRSYNAKLIEQLANAILQQEKKGEPVKIEINHYYHDNAQHNDHSKNVYLTK